MFLAKQIPTDHKDMIHDVAYDFHGKRMATSSCDQYIKIWDLLDGEWKCTASWKAHSGVVWKVIWAYPEFGQVLATCSYDRTVAVWEETPNEDGVEMSKWVKRGNLVDSRCSIVDVKFAPRHHGLKLAMCSVDGNIRIYEAPDIMNLCQWNLQNEIICKVNCNCIAWSSSRIHPPLIAIGCEDTANSQNVLIYEYSEQIRQWIKVEALSTMPGPVRDLSFSPNLGRSYELLAVAGKEVAILWIKQLPQNKKEESQIASKYEVRCVGSFNDHQSQVWRLSWNVTGTILASSGDDGNVKLWKGNYMDTWRCISTLKSNNSTALLKKQNSQGGNSSTPSTSNSKSLIDGTSKQSGHTGTNSTPSILMNNNSKSVAEKNAALSSEFNRGSNNTANGQPMNMQKNNQFFKGGVKSQGVGFTWQ